MRMNRQVKNVYIAVLAATGWLAVSAVQAETAVPFDIPAQSLADALIAVANQTDTNIYVDRKLVGDRQSPPLKASLTVDQAIEKLLHGTGLSIKRIDDRTIALVVPAAAAEVREADATLLSMDDRRDALRVAQAESTTENDSGSKAGQSNGSSAASTASQTDTQLDEVVVTATRREERLMDVPISIQAITAEDIDRRGLRSAEDYLRGIPGVNQVSTPQGESIVIRGVETNAYYQNFFGAATVASYFGETPTTSSQGAAGFSNIDVKLADIERVEVLRGPQGTAFGSSALGGAVRTIPVAPKLDRFEGKMVAGYSVTSGSGGDNYDIQAVGNFPIINDRFAVRAVAYQYEQSGFYRNVAGSDLAFLAAAAASGAQVLAANQDEVGLARHMGGRIAALFQATDDLKFTLNYLTQKGEVNGQGFADTGTYDQRYLQVLPEQLVRGQTAGAFDSKLDIWNVVAEYDLSWANILGTYSYTDSSAMTVNAAGGLPLLAVSSQWPGYNTGRIAEVRLATTLEGAWNFIGGVYSEDMDDEAFFYPSWVGGAAENIFTPGETGRMGDYTTVRNLKQKAAFGEVSWEFLRGWKLTGGARYYDYDRAETTSSSGPWYGDVPAQLIEAQAEGTVYRGNLSYKINDNALAYAGWSQGFRLGRAQNGLNSNCDPDGDGTVDGTSVTLESTKLVRSDNVDNYEIGTKLSLLNKRLTIAADVYRIDWVEVPFLVDVVGLGSTAGPEDGCYPLYTANAGSARSEGIELQANYYVTRGLRVDFGGSSIDAELTKDVLALNAPAGTRLPVSPKVNLNLGLQYEFNVRGREAFVRADSIYIGSFNTQLTDPEPLSGGYTKVDLAARMAFQNLSIDLYARNVTNRKDFTFGGLSLGGGGFSGYRLRPRTIGLQLSYNFRPQ